MLVRDLFDLLQQVETDMTLFFRCLMEISASTPMGDTTGNVTNNADHMEDAALAGRFSRAFYDEQQALAPAQLGRLAGWLRRYIARVRLDGEPAELVYQRMSRANPKYVLRNYMAQQAIEALEQGDASVMTRIMDVLQRPYDEQPEHEDLAGRRPEWARNKAGCSALSCSS